MQKYFYSCFILCFVISTHSAISQEVSITLGESEIGVNQLFTITATVKNESIKNITDFPNIPGFTKRNVSTSSTTNYINGQMSSSQSRTQNYLPKKEGTYTIKPFAMTVNGRTVRSPGKTVKVGPPVQRRRRNFFDQDPFEDFFGRPKKQQEFVDVEADAFLALTVDKNEVYQGEGFTTTLAFYVSAQNRADMRFYELGKQITEITSKIKPSNCWEESFNIDNITGEPVTINNRRYTQYKVYQATFFPWNTEPINFPSVDLELIKYKVAKNPSFFGRNKQEDFQKFSSRPKTVVVKELPPHPMKEVVSVGTYRLKEEIDKKQLATGESFNYRFNVTGVGNINAIEDPLVFKDQDDINIYDPNKQININRSSNRVSGTKSYSFYGIPNEPGSYKLQDYFSWIYFDPRVEAYDTLLPTTEILVTGESKKNESISATDLGSFYDKIEFADNDLSATESWINSRSLYNVIAALVLLMSAGMLGYQVVIDKKVSAEAKEENTLARPKETAPLILPEEEDDRSIFEKLAENRFLNGLGWGLIIVLFTMVIEFFSVQFESVALINIYAVVIGLAMPLLFYVYMKKNEDDVRPYNFLQVAVAFLGIVSPLLVYIFLFDGVALGSILGSRAYFGMANTEYIEIIAIFIVIPLTLAAAYFLTQQWEKKVSSTS